MAFSSSRLGHLDALLVEELTDQYVVREQIHGDIVDFLLGVPGGLLRRNSRKSSRVIGWPLTVPRTWPARSARGVRRPSAWVRGGGGLLSQGRQGQGRGRDRQQAGAETLSHRTRLPDGCK